MIKCSNPKCLSSNRIDSAFCRVCRNEFKFNAGAAFYEAKSNSLKNAVIDLTDECSIFKNDSQLDMVKHDLKFSSGLVEKFFSNFVAGYNAVFCLYNEISPGEFARMTLIAAIIDNSKPVNVIKFKIENVELGIDEFKARPALYLYYGKVYIVTSKRIIDSGFDYRRLSDYSSINSNDHILLKASELFAVKKAGEETISANIIMTPYYFIVPLSKVDSGSQSKHGGLVFVDPLKSGDNFKHLAVPRDQRIAGDTYELYDDAELKRFVSSHTDLLLRDHAIKNILSDGKSSIILMAGPTGEAADAGRIVYLNISDLEGPKPAVKSVKTFELDDCCDFYPNNSCLYVNMRDGENLIFWADSRYGTLNSLPVKQDGSFGEIIKESYKAPAADASGQDDADAQKNPDTGEEVYLNYTVGKDGHLGYKFIRQGSFFTIKGINIPKSISNFLGEVLKKNEEADHVVGPVAMAFNGSWGFMFAIKNIIYFWDFNTEKYFTPDAMKAGARQILYYRGMGFVISDDGLYTIEKKPPAAAPAQSPGNKI